MHKTTETTFHRVWRLVLRDFVRGRTAEVARCMADSAVAAGPRVPMLVLLCNRGKKCWRVMANDIGRGMRQLTLSRRATHRGRRVWKDVGWTLAIDVAWHVLLFRPDDLLVAVVDGNGRMVRHEQWLRFSIVEEDSFKCNMRRAFASVGVTNIV